jgi:hypothetical protein
MAKVWCSFLWGREEGGMTGVLKPQTIQLPNISQNCCYHTVLPEAGGCSC